MSKTQLQTNNAKLEALITELQGKAAGGGSGGGSIDTCTLIFYTGGGADYELLYGIYGVCATVVNEDGAIDALYKGNLAPGSTTTIDNVVCGSMVYCRTDDSFVTTSGAQAIASGAGQKVYKITAGAGETAEIRGYLD